MAALRNEASAGEPGRREDANPRTHPGRDNRGLAAIPAGDPLAPVRARAAIHERGGAHRQERRPPRPRPRNRPRHAGPIPPRTQTGVCPSASAACNSTNEDSAPPHPPASLPATISPATLAAIERPISALDVTSPEPAGRSSESLGRRSQRMAVIARTDGNTDDTRANGAVRKPR